MTVARSNPVVESKDGLAQVWQPWSKMGQNRSLQSKWPNYETFEIVAVFDFEWSWFAPVPSPGSTPGRGTMQ